MLFLPGNQKGLETHPQLSIIGCELPPRRLMAKSQEGQPNVETPGRLYRPTTTLLDNTSWNRLGGHTTIPQAPASGIVAACLGIQVRIVHSCVSAIKINVKS
jgi:hypothetical protein